MIIAIASDHGGLTLKTTIIAWFKSQAIKYIDFGCCETIAVDYPDYAQKVAEAVTTKKCNVGIVICGSGIGVSIAANKVKGIRCALVHNVELAKLSKLHNNSNVLALGGRFVSDQVGIAIVKTWLNTDYEGGRHDQRIAKIKVLEKNE